jgi:hypothetical protein
MGVPPSVQGDRTAEPPSREGEQLLGYEPRVRLDVVANGGLVQPRRDDRDRVLAVERECVLRHAVAQGGQQAGRQHTEGGGVSLDQADERTEQLVLACRASRPKLPSHVLVGEVGESGFLLRPADPLGTGRYRSFERGLQVHGIVPPGSGGGTSSPTPLSPSATRKLTKNLREISIDGAGRSVGAEGVTPYLI